MKLLWEDKIGVIRELDVSYFICILHGDDVWWINHDDDD